MRRVETERMFDVGQQQFLMLLLVVQPEGDKLIERGVTDSGGEQALHAVVHSSAVELHIGERRPGDQPALSSRVHVAHTLVVAVEQHAECRVERLEIGLEALKDERLEKPGQVREVPFGRTGVGHRLHLAVFG